MEKYKLGEEPETDIAYWKQKTPLERIQALEDLRQQYINFFMNGVQPRFQRVYKITQQKVTNREQDQIDIKNLQGSDI